MANQEQFVFHADENHPETQHLRKPPSNEERLFDVDFVNNPKCPFYNFIGNENAKRRLTEQAFVSLGRYNHSCAEGAFYLSGPASVGKTSLAKLFAKLLQIPFVECHPRAIQKVSDLFNTICSQMNANGLKIVPVRGFKFFRLPPCIILIDEVHGLSQLLVDALLKACEANDRQLATENGNLIDCCNVCWMIATTEAGDLFSAFESRFDEIQMMYYTRGELAKIVKINNPDFDDEVCALIAKYQRLPRRLLKFAQSMRNKKEMYPNKEWNEIALEVAADNRIDAFGMPIKHLDVLKALEPRPIARERLPIILGVPRAEMERKLMPELLASFDDMPPLIEVCSDGYRLTEAGLGQLEKRK